MKLNGQYVGAASITVFPMPDIRILYNTFQRNLAVPLQFNLIGPPVPVPFGTIVALPVANVRPLRCPISVHTSAPIFNYCAAPGSIPAFPAGHNVTGVAGVHFMSVMRQDPILPQYKKGRYFVATIYNRIGINYDGDVRQKPKRGRFYLPPFT